MSNVTSNRSTHHQNHDQAQQLSDGDERGQRGVFSGWLGKAALLAAAGGAIFGLVKISEGHSGPDHNKATEVGIERVIKPEMQKIAQAALKPEADQNLNVISTQVAKGITEISSVATDDGEVLDVVMRDFPGTTKPNPKDVLATDLQVNFNANSNPNVGAFSYDEVLYAAPGSSKYLSLSQANGLYAVDKEGWTAIDNSINGTNGNVNESASSTLDAADPNYYAAVDGSLTNTVGPIGTAKDTVYDAENLLPTIVDSLK
jgi:hypothetical protein